ncbi:MAG: hypothetical protein HN420_02835, partial [Rhodospirillaceae bacterium]|nr:hypothetical protein [Rhodospirillaceae bacterium]
MARDTTKTPRSLRIAFFGLLAILVLAPLPFGSNRLWAWSFLSIVIGLLTLLWTYGVVRMPGSIRIPVRRHLPATIMFGLAIIWFLIQASGLTPAAWDHPIWAEAAAALGREKTFGAISLDPNASFDGAMRLLAYGAVFWLALHFGRSRRLARRILWAIVISGSVYSLYGLAVQFSGSNTILWFDKWAYGDVVTSTFVNRNSFGTYAGLVIIAAFGLLTWEADEAASLGIANRVGIVHMIDSMGARVFGLLVALFITGSALLFSASRGGPVAIVQDITLTRFRKPGHRHDDRGRPGRRGRLLDQRTGDITSLCRLKPGGDIEVRIAPGQDHAPERPDVAEPERLIVIQVQIGNRIV